MNILLIFFRIYMSNIIVTTFMHPAQKEDNMEAI